MMDPPSLWKGVWLLRHGEPWKKRRGGSGKLIRLSKEKCCLKKSGVTRQDEGDNTAIGLMEVKNGVVW